MLTAVRIDKLVHGGQALGTLEDGRRVLVWNALPGELVNVRLVKSKSKYAEGFAEEVIEASPERLEPLDDAYLSTSPWQVMTWAAENRYKKAILEETFAREKADVPIHVGFVAAEAEETAGGKYDNGVLHYRNKMEYSFWGDDDGLHLALFHRGSHGKRIITGSSIARPEIDVVANKICSILNEHGIRGSQLKTVVVRCNQAGDCVASVFVKDETFPVIEALSEVCKGVVVNFSNPKSPASILTKELYLYGNTTLQDKILDTEIIYSVHGFFQVNLPIFERALQAIRREVAAEPIIDFYSGVGTIGIPVGATVLVESDADNIVMARLNVQNKNIEVVHATAETAINHITPGATLIVDPPRAGLHKDVIERIREVKPSKVLYLSCNPVTQARDVALLQDIYELTKLDGYNFFPRTPHIESLAVLNLF